MKVVFVIFLIMFLSQIARAADGVTITPTANATTLNLTTTNTNLSLGSIRLTLSGSSTTPIVYDLKITSQNGGLKNSNAITKGASVANAIIPYTLSWGVVSGTVDAMYTLTINSTVQQLLITETDNSGSKSVTGNLQFTRTGTSASSLYSGTWADVLTVTLVNKKTNATIVKTLNINSSTVQDTITLTVTPAALSSNLPLATSQSQSAIGTVSITANCQNGYMLQVASSNAGKLVHNLASGSPGTNEFINYSLFYQGSQVVTSTTPVTLVTNSTATLLTNSTQIGNLGISYSGIVPSAMRAGTYQDNLTFTLTSQ